MFSIGVSYERADILNAVGSKQPQSGIIWGPAQPDLVIVTSGGRYGKRVGYSDQCLPDGTWQYHGQGETGDQKSGSYANRILIEENRTVALFSTREPTSAEVRSRQNWRKVYSFEGMFRVSGRDYLVPERGSRAGDKLLLFRLVPEVRSDNSNAGVFDHETIALSRESLSSLRQSLLATPLRPIRCLSSIAHHFRRSRQLYVYALKRSGGRCECCGRDAPFSRPNGFVYLEVHHINRLSDGGPDHPQNVAAVCPNCHREAHHGHHAMAINGKLVSSIRVIEENIAFEESSERIDGPR